MPPGAGIATSSANTALMPVTRSVFAAAAENARSAASSSSATCRGETLCRVMDAGMTARARSREIVFTTISLPPPPEKFHPRDRHPRIPRIPRIDEVRAAAKAAGTRDGDGLSRDPNPPRLSKSVTVPRAAAPGEARRPRAFSYPSTRRSCCRLVFPKFRIRPRRKPVALR